ncbi:MAG: hypothetical protein CFE23_02075 [Flavobacterium sp. BFFFF1]|uniref:hypothetical protein n=1 Tax=unclassified Flavobacterium TaxID=196869 RepID=UPI000BC90F24|nr:MULTISPECIES: hypothetical protein [unclassified Flavobacterium]OYU82104.1 MAG: hypothetical protein CFE23_02075 [Flavobacterium sp. BFFFF1]
MKPITTLFFLFFSLSGCNNKVELEKCDKNGKLIVYSERVYSEMWIKNKKLNVTVIDTFCINQKAKALEDIRNGKLVYFGFHPREFKKMTAILKRFGIETKEHLSRCARIGGFEPYCYQNAMYDEINRKFGENFIDSIFRVAQKEYIIENPNVEYFDDGIDLRKKYKVTN